MKPLVNKAREPRFPKEIKCPFLKFLSLVSLVLGDNEKFAARRREVIGEALWKNGDPETNEPRII